MRQLGSIRPDLDHQWGGLGPATWESATRVDPGSGEAFVWAKHHDAQLTLPASAPVDRELELRLAVPLPSQPEVPVPEVSVRLNGVLVGTLPATTEPADYVLDVPGAAWVMGDNLLQLAIPYLIPTAGDSGSTHRGVALYGVGYGPEQIPRIDPAAGRLGLVAGTSVTYGLELAAGTALRVAGKATASGTLGIDVSRFDPADGSRAEEYGSLRIPVEGVLDRTLPLSAMVASEAPEATTVVLDLSWTGDGGAGSFEVSALEVIEDAPPPRPPVILISIDTLSARNLSLYGYARETCPNLEAFADDAVLFEDCVTNCTWTLPSFLSLMTGLYAGSHRLDDEGVYNPDLWEQWFLADNRTTLAETLRAAGYATAGFVDNVWLSPQFGFPQGFEAYDSSAAGISKTDHTGGVRQVVRSGSDWLDTLEEDQPFFLFLHCFDAHGPYSSTPEFARHFEDDALPQDELLLPARGQHAAYGVVHSYITEALYPGGSTPPRVPAGEIIDAYDRGIALVDDCIGAFLDDLRARGLYEEAMIVVTADHGETMEEGSIPFAHSILEEAVTHVPLLVKFPGNAGGSSRIDSRVQLVDLFPTVLEVASVSVEGRGLHGRSLLPLLQGDQFPERPTFTESGVMRQEAIQFGDWRLTRQVPGAESAPSTLLSWPGNEAAWTERELPELGDHGLTVEANRLLEQREDYDLLVADLRRRWSQPVIRLQRTGDESAVDLSEEFPAERERLESLLARLLEERDRARDLARPPSSPPDLQAADVAELESLGYVGD